MRLSELGELGLLAELERNGLARGSRTTPRSSPAASSSTQDALVEGVHFRLDWICWRDLGWRAAAVNLSDLAASGAEPEGLLVSLALPGDDGVDDVVELYEGIAETACPWSAATPLTRDRAHAQRHRARALGPRARTRRCAPRTSSSSSPVPSAPQAPRFGGRCTCVRRLRLREGRSLAAHAARRCSISPTGSRSMQATSPSAPAAES